MKSSLRSACYLLVLLNLVALSVAAKPVTLRDTGIATAIATQVKKHQKELYYPLSVTRFYKNYGYKLAWIAPDTVKTHATDAMLLLDCILQYGLNHADYHPKKLLYTELSLLTSRTVRVSNERKALFDIWLTDAMITFINNLHYGNFNPDYRARKIDVNRDARFNAAVILNNALKNKDFIKVITQVQPPSKIYQDLRYHMYLETGLYTGDCYEFPENGIRAMAINMERLRWYSIRKEALMEINIPSGMLTVHLQDSDYYFKLKIKQVTLRALANQLNGTGQTSISVLHGQMVLRIKSDIRKDLQELNAISLIKEKSDKLFPLNVVKSRRLEALLLFQQVKNIQMNAVPVNLTYITCEIKNGEPVTYKDIYSLDKGLKHALYRAAAKRD
ncbi:MAG: hypothetical protein JWQ66_3704 [Mucilaginibacter sp.]|nr:hypothetical protein [Mucilaginibacter sp.]